MIGRDAAKRLYGLAVRSHARRGLEEDLPADDLRHVALLGILTLGFPASMAAMSWIDDIAGGLERG